MAKNANAKKSEKVTELKEVEKLTQYGVTRPKDASSIVGKVWAYADLISKKKGSPATRAEVMKACTEEGINPATTATQYGKWRKFNGLGSVGRGHSADAEEDTKPEKTSKAKSEKKTKPVPVVEVEKNEDEDEDEDLDEDEDD